MQENKWERLYKKAKSGAIQICDISTAGSTIDVVTGQLNGAMRTYITKCVGMNPGKANETTPTTQAKKEAEAKWVKKQKDGYVLDPSGESNVKKPMRLRRYQDHKSKIQFPCLVGPKKNGVNGIYKRKSKEDRTLTILSRGGEIFHPIPHLEEEINNLMDALLDVGIEATELNVELFIPGYSLQKITSAVKKPKELSKKLEAHVFEIPSSPLSFEGKVDKMDSIIDQKFVKIVPNIEMNSHQEIDIFLEKCIKEGEEGCVVRNKDCLYEYNTQSLSAFKYKPIQDGEYQIVDYTIDKNGHPVFVCKIPPEDGGHTFRVKVKGDDQKRKHISTIADSWINQWLKIEYEMLSDSNKPLKPVGIGLRDCDINGDPII